MQQIMVLRKLHKRMIGLMKAVIYTTILSNMKCHTILTNFLKNNVMRNTMHQAKLRLNMCKIIRLHFGIKI